MIKQTIEMLEEILELDPGSVKESDEFREYEDWDSLAYLSVIAKIDEDFGMVIPREEFQKLRTVSQLATYISEHIK